MIYFICKYFLALQPGLEWLRLINYLTVRSIAAAITAFLLLIIFGSPVIRMLYRRGARDTVHGYGMVDVESKRGTPTMGGVMIVGALLISILLWSDLTNRFVQMITFSMLSFAAIGFWDDYLKIKHRDSRDGLSQSKKLVLQSVIALIFMLIYLSPTYSPLTADKIHLLQDMPANITPENYMYYLQVPFKKFPVVNLSWFYLPFGMFVFLAVSNSVNFADGLDGLAIVPATLTAAVFGIFAYIIGNVFHSSQLLFTHLIGSGEVTIIMAALIGAGVGFLWFNAYPAQVFMGDTGSMALGGILAAVCILIKQEFIFVIAGGIFVVEGASVLIQEKIGISRLGRRIFHRAPIHHNFQHFGIAEIKVVIRFWIVGIILMLLALATIKVR